MIKKPNWKSQQFENQKFDGFTLAPYMKTIEQNLLHKTTFVNCNIDEVHVRTIQSCKFKNCKLNTFYMRKGTIVDCEFEDCQLIDIGLLKGDIIKSNFTNCTFINFNLGIGCVKDSNFKDCQFQLDNEWMFQPISPIDRNNKLWHEGEWRTVTDWQEFLRLQTPN